MHSPPVGTALKGLMITFSESQMEVNFDAGFSHIETSYIVRFDETVAKVPSLIT